MRTLSVLGAISLDPHCHDCLLHQSRTLLYKTPFRRANHICELSACIYSCKYWHYTTVFQMQMLARYAL